MAPTLVELCLTLLARCSAVFFLAGWRPAVTVLSAVLPSRGKTDVGTSLVQPRKNTDAIFEEVLWKQSIYLTKNATKASLTFHARSQ